MKTLLVIIAFGLLSGCASTRQIEPRMADEAADFGQAETIEVKLSNFAFTPSEISLTAGRPYILKFVNTASGGHDFTAPGFFADVSVAPGDSALIADGQIKLNGGATTLLRIIPAAGQYKIVCTHFGHAALGMTGQITVH